MKFPYNLSEQRLTLLTPEDLALYKYEHSPFYSYEDKVKSISAYKNSYNNYMNTINEDAEFKDMNEEEKEEMSKKLVEIEALEYLDEIEEFVRPLISEGLTVAEYNEIKEAARTAMLEYVQLSLNEASLNENVPGPDMHVWLDNCGWLGKFAGGLLTLGLGGLVGLFMAGKDKAAAKALERYMNRLVELTDDGTNKKKSIFSFFGMGKNRADQTQMCFRSIQEFAERTIAKDAMIVGKAAGFFQNGKELQDALSANTCTGGLSIFNELVVKPANDYAVTKVKVK